MAKKSYKRTKESNQKNSLAHKGIPNIKNRGKNNGRWKGGIRKHSDGYIETKNRFHPFCYSDGYVLEHRIIIEKQINRYLLKNEHVHHLGKKNDNRPHMLMAFVSNSAHQRFHKNPNNVKPEEIIFDGRLL